MRIIHSKGYTDDERMIFRNPIYLSLVMDIIEIIKAMKAFNINFKFKSNEVRHTLFFNKIDQCWIH